MTGFAARVATAVWVLVLVACLALSFVFTRGYLEELQKNLAQRGRIIGESVAHESELALLSGDMPSLARIGSAVERSAWLQAAIERGRLDPQAARLELRKALGGAKGVSIPAPSPTPRAATRAALLPAEKWLLALLFRGAPGSEDALRELEDAD